MASRVSSKASPAPEPQQRSMRSPAWRLRSSVSALCFTRLAAESDDAPARAKLCKSLDAPVKRVLQDSDLGAQLSLMGMVTSWHHAEQQYALN